MLTPDEDQVTGGMNRRQEKKSEAIACGPTYKDDCHTIAGDSQNQPGRSISALLWGWEIRGSRDPFRGSSHLIRGSSGPIRGSRDAIGGAGHLIRGSTDAFRGSGHSTCGSSRPFRGSDDPLHGSSHLIPGSSRQAIGGRRGFLLSRSVQQDLQSPVGVPRLRRGATSFLESSPKQAHQRTTKLRHPRSRPGGVAHRRHGPFRPMPAGRRRGLEEA